MSNPSTDRAAATKIIDAVVAAGWTLDSVDDGGEDIAVSTTREAWDVIDSVDTSHCWFTRDNGHRRAAIMFVLGNEPFEVAADYHTSLAEPIESLTSRWDG